MAVSCTFTGDTCIRKDDRNISDSVFMPMKTAASPSRSFRWLPTISKCDLFCWLHVLSPAGRSGCQNSTLATSLDVSQMYLG